jgi:PPE-repeat protein
MEFPVLPPEINSARMHAGAGSAPMLTAATAWDGLAAELWSAARSFGSVTSRVAGQSWQGPSSLAMMAAAAPYVAWLGAAATHSEHAAGQARAVASAYETARATTVHPMAVAANRIQLVSLVSSNLLGQNTPAIAEIEARYEGMWAQDVSAMVGYHAGVSVAAAQLMPSPELLRGLPGQAICVTVAAPPAHATPGIATAPTTSARPAAAATPASYRSVVGQWLYDELAGASTAFHNAAKFGPAAIDDAKNLLTFPSNSLGWQSYLNNIQSLVEDTGGYVENVAVGVVDLVALPATAVLVPVSSLADSVSNALGLPVPASAS